QGEPFPPSIGAGLRLHFDQGIEP
ncbi:MAG: hypothetical protein RLY86_4297, partial [Pseudomonadota bacterium]